MSWPRKDIQRLAFVFSLCVPGSDTLPSDTAEIIWNCIHCDVCREIRVPVQTCIVSDRNLFMYPFRQHGIEPQEHARPWFGTSLLRVTTRNKGVFASVYVYVILGLSL